MLNGAARVNCSWAAVALPMFVAVKVISTGVLIVVLPKLKSETSESSTTANRVSPGFGSGVGERVVFRPGANEDPLPHDTTSKHIPAKIIRITILLIMSDSWPKSQDVGILLCKDRRSRVGKA